MAFALNNLSVLAYANGFTLWHYKAYPDEPGAVATPGFFHEAGDMLTVGDIVMVSAPSGARVVCVVPQGRLLSTAPLA